MRHGGRRFRIHRRAHKQIISALGCHIFLCPCIPAFCAWLSYVFFAPSYQSFLRSVVVFSCVHLVLSALGCGTFLCACMPAFCARSSHISVYISSPFCTRWLHISESIYSCLYSVFVRFTVHVFPACELPGVWHVFVISRYCCKSCLPTRN